MQAEIKTTAKRNQPEAGLGPSNPAAAGGGGRRRTSTKEWSSQEQAAFVGQMAAPVARQNGLGGVLPWVLKSHHKIVNYDLETMKVWKTIIMYSHTILARPSVYGLLLILTAVCLATTTIVLYSGASKSSK